MSDKKIDCYVLPSAPLPILLPLECVAEIVNNPTILSLKKASAKWMKGHVNWHKQRVSLMSFEALLDAAPTQASDNKQCLVVLNAIPDAARNSYSGLLVDDGIEQITIENTQIDYSDLPEGVNQRYVEMVVRIGERQFIVPKLTALAVAFTYI